MKLIIQLAMTASFALGSQAFAQSSAATPKASIFGTPASTAEVERTIEILPTTRWINVTRFETVRLAIRDGNEAKYVIWRFDTLSFTPFDLSQAIPSLAARSIKVFVGASHLDMS